MDMKEFMRSHDKDERAIIAVKAGTTLGYFAQLAGKHRRPSPQLAKRLELASGGKMTRKELLPEVFGDD